MSFSRGWRQRRAVAQHRAAQAQHGSNPYREWMNQQRENERRALQGLPPLTDEPPQHRETQAEAKAHRDSDAIVLPLPLDEIDDDTPTHNRTLN